MRFFSISLLVSLPIVIVTVTAGREDPTRPGGAKSNPTAAVELKDVRFSRNMVNSIDKNIPAEWGVQVGATKNVKWAVKIGTGRTGYLPPAISGGKVFIATNNTAPSDPKVKGSKAILKCLRESDGQFLWQIVHDPPPPEISGGPGTSAVEDGLLSTPFVEENRLYYVAPAGEVVCADTDGKIIWRYDMMKELKVVPCFCTMCCPLVVGDRMFVVTGNGVDFTTGKVVSPGAPSFVAFDKQTGKLSWSSNLPGANILDGQWTSPAYTVAGGRAQVIFPGGDGWVYSLNPDTGSLVWKFDCNPKNPNGKRAGRDAPNYLLAAPVVYDDKVYIGVGHNPEGGPGGHVGHFWCIDATKTGDVSPVAGNLDARADVNKNSALVWHYGGLVVPEPKRGRREVFGFTLSTPAIQDGLVYISEYDGILHCLDAKTGQKYWEFDLLTSVWSSPYYVDGKVYLGADNGDLAVFPAGKTPPLKDNVKKIITEFAIKAPVVAANGTLYVVTATHLYAIAGK
jgi:outer membrane protein assembly factor BamB